MVDQKVEMVTVTARISKKRAFELQVEAGELQKKTGEHIASLLTAKKQ